MNKKEERHLPQIEYYYDGYIYPFIGKASLKELIEMRETWLNYKNPCLYRRDDRKTYKRQLVCIERCINILFSEPNDERVKLKIQEDKIERNKRLKSNEELDIFQIIEKYRKNETFDSDE
jgi:hypothetical protein